MTNLIEGDFARQKYLQGKLVGVGENVNRLSDDEILKRKYNCMGLAPVLLFSTFFRRSHAGLTVLFYTARNSLQKLSNKLN